MLSRIRKVKDPVLVAFVVIVMLLFVLGQRTVSYLREKSARSSGTLVTSVLKADDFELIGIRTEEDGYVTENDDPQMIYMLDGTLSSVRIEMKYSLEPGEIVMYYTNPGDAGFSPRKRVWAVLDGETGYIFSLPMQQVSRIRIDPTMYPSNQLEIGNIEINPLTGADRYYSVSAPQVFYFLIYAGMLSAILKFLLVLTDRDGKEKSGRRQD